MNFNPDPKRQAQEIIFSPKVQKQGHPSIFFNQSLVIQENSQKHLGILLDTKLDFKEYLPNISNKANKAIMHPSELQIILTRSSRLIIYKSLIKPLFKYGYDIYDQPYNASFHQRAESSQHNAAVAITGSIRDSSRENIYEQLGLEFRKQRRWY